MKSHLMRAFKITGAAVLAIVLASLLQLEYAVTAGIITVLSIQNTKRETLKTARNRGLAFACALGIAWVCYAVLGFTIPAFTVYLFFFAFLCLYATWPEAIAMDSVLISHFLAAKSFSAEWFINEVLLFLIGTAFGVLVNLLLRRKEKEFENLAAQVDDEIKEILHRMHENLCVTDKENYKADCFTRLSQKIQAAKAAAMKNWNNTLWNNSEYELGYIKMRENQNRVLWNIYQSIKRIHSLPKQTLIVAEFIRQIEAEYHRDNDVHGLLQKLQEVYEKMQDEPLPVSREEFEARAALFYLLKQLEEFLSLKKNFVEKHRRFINGT